MATVSTGMVVESDMWDILSICDGELNCADIFGFSLPLTILWVLINGNKH